MQVRDRFAGVRTVVDDETKAFGKVQFFRDRSGDEKQVPEYGLVAWIRRADASDDVFRHDQQVNRRLRLDVVQDDAMFVLVFDLRRNFALDDPLKNRLGHGEKRIACENTRNNRKGKRFLLRVSGFSSATETTAADWSREPCGRRRARG